MKRGNTVIVQTTEAPDSFPLIPDALDVPDATMFLVGSGTNQRSGIPTIGGTNGLTTTQRMRTNMAATFGVNAFRYLEVRQASAVLRHVTRHPSKSARRGGEAARRHYHRW